MDVVEILPNAFGGDVWVNVADDEVTSGSDANLICNVTRKDELAVVPSEFNLELLISRCRRYIQLVDLLSCRECKCRSAWHSS